jgi:peptidase E
VPADSPTIVATSIGIPLRPRLPLDRRGSAVFRLALELAQPRAAPRLCYLATATGDAPESLARAYTALAELDVHLSHLSLFPMPNVEDVREHLLRQDVIWVGGGSVVNLLAVWRAHGLERILHECWQAGVVLGGVSAGSLCWHVGGTTDSFGLELQPVTDALGWLPYANGVHYDSEAQRRPLLQRLVASGQLPTAYATDDGVGLIYRGTHMVEAVAQEQGKAAYLVERGPDNRARETVLSPRLLD